MSALLSVQFMHHCTPTRNLGQLKGVKSNAAVYSSLGKTFIYLAAAQWYSPQAGGKLSHPRKKKTMP